MLLLTEMQQRHENFTARLYIKADNMVDYIVLKPIHTPFAHGAS